jgi:superfamily II DNA or RNA helicase
VKLCFDHVIKDAGIHQLIQDGYLSPYNHFSIPNWEVETVADTYLREPSRWGKSIFYFKNLEECFKLAHILKNSGVLCDVVTGDTDCEHQLKAFRSGAIPVLINCMKLTEGFDDPTLKTAWVRDSGKGCTMQMGGRAFRKCEGLSHKQIVQSKLTRWPLLRTAMPDEQYVWQEDNWMSLKVNPHLNQITVNARRAIAETVVEIPPFISNKVAKGRRRRQLRRV